MSPLPVNYHYHLWKLDTREKKNTELALRGQCNMIAALSSGDNSVRRVTSSVSFRHLSGLFFLTLLALIDSPKRPILNFSHQRNHDL